MYDLANTVFAMGVAGRYFAPYAVSRGSTDAHIGAVAIVSGALVAAAAPWFGSLGDRTGKRRRLLAATTLVTVAATALLGAVPLGAALVLYGIASAGFHLGSIVYDALLPAVSTEADRGRVSGIGVAVGYLGSALALGIGAFVLPRFGHRVLFAALAGAFLAFALPAFVAIREPGPLPAASRPRGVVSTLADVWRHAAREPRIIRFLVGRFMYVDAANTFFLFSAVYVRHQVGLDDKATDVVAFVGVLSALAGAALAGSAVDRAGPARVLRAAVSGLLAAVLLGVAAGTGGPRAAAYLAAIAGGAAVGAAWTSDRVLLTRLAPQERLGEMFGLSATVGRFSVLAGPALWALASGVSWLGRPGALGALGVLLVVSLLALRRVDDAQVDQPASAPDSPAPTMSS
ncbi:MAG: MFS transporter [Coriobacteriia bacterium]|nr:MFS transporter [Coriobacteriia bacterium]